MDELHNTSASESVDGAVDANQGAPSMSTSAATSAAADIIKEAAAPAVAALPMGPCVVVKVASQSLPDMTVDCMQNWIVRDLKNFLHDKHALHPPVKEQRLIYSGQLLGDESSLVSILRHSSPSDPHSVVHLVCAPAKSSSQLNTPQHRAPASVTRQTTGTNSETNVTSQLSQQQRTASEHVSAGPVLPPDAAAQAVALQQYYAQYLASYMTYLQTNGVGDPTSAAAATAWVQQMQQPHLLAGAADPSAVQQQQANVGAVTGEAPLQEENERAGAEAVNGALDNLGGAGAEEEGFAPDWLDSMYIAARLAIFVFLVYFNSSMYRFIFLMAVTFLLYLYHVGWFRGPRPVQEPPRQEPLVVDQQVEDNGEREIVALMDDRNNNVPDNNSSNNNDVVPEAQRDQPYQEAGDEPQQQVRQRRPLQLREDMVDEGREQGATVRLPAEEVAANPAPPSWLGLSWTFVTAFITSIIPEQQQLL